MFNKDKGKKFSLAKILGAVTGLVTLFLYSKKGKKLLSGERREIKELFTGQEDWRQFWHDSKSILKDAFIPHEGNGHKPKALRPKALATYAAIAIAVKVVVTGFLFFTYPSQAYL